MLRAMAGAMLLWGGVRLCFGVAPVAAGWVGFAAIVLMLHFGSLHLISLLWRRSGVATGPIMNAPWRATSPAEFWGQRWNLAFRDLAYRYVFEPLRRPLGAPVAMFAAFVASGLVHELVISLPAGGGYGRPTAYFAIQSVAVVGSHARMARKWGLTRGWRGRLFTLVVVLGPLPLVFHPAFMHHVVVPFLDVVGAL
jgi:alginate O-acetyltransferase complex protein AlgI